MNPPTALSCDWCDNPPVVCIPELGNLCRGCLAGPDQDDGHHYQLRHEPFLTACFAAPSPSAALDRLRGYLDANTTTSGHLAAHIDDAAANVLLEQGVCVPLGGAENVQLTTCFCDEPLEP